MTDLFSGVGEEICHITIPVLSPKDSLQPVQLTNPLDVASYSWLEKPEPTILVPGSAPTFKSDISPPFTVAKDNFPAFVDQNTHRFPTHPLQPLIASTLHLHPSYDFCEVETITDRNSLRKLLRWIRGGEMVTTTTKDFRIDVQAAGDVVLFVRKETKTIETASRGYGVGFERHVTTDPPNVPEGMKQTSHHRVVRYNFEGTELLVRFELDASLRSSNSSDVDDLLSAMENLNLSNTTSSANLGIVPSNSPLVRSSDTIELVTISRKFKRGFNWSENYPQLLFGQTHNVYLGVHDFGKFKSIEKRTLAELQNGAVGEELQGDLKKLGKALKDIRALVSTEASKGDGEQLMSLVCKNSVLSLCRRTDGKQALPPEHLSLLSA